jgi:hypothetical protein
MADTKKGDKIVEEPKQEPQRVINLLPSREKKLKIFYFFSNSREILISYFPLIGGNLG